MPDVGRQGQGHLGWLGQAHAEPRCSAVGHAARRTDTGGDDWWKVPPDVGIELMGPDSDYRCGGKKGFKSCYGSSSTYSEAEINKPMNSIYVPAGISSDKLEGLAGASYQLPTCQAMPSLTAPSRS
ncbi:hypothetical protein B0324_1476 [Bifidobacterium bifidum]|nr:hypothetical protein B0324_1476 [Bifidobacterium bifidum]